MRELTAACWVELLKVRRSRVPWVFSVAVALVPMADGLFMFILADPRRARAMGLLGAKAQLAVASADWPGYFGLLHQGMAGAGLLLFSLVFIWMFGREFSDRCVKDLLALPTRRAAVVAAKFLVGSAWCLLLGVQTCLLGLLVGLALGLPGWSGALAVASVGRLLMISVLSVLVVAPFAAAASIARGYLAAVGLVFLAVFLAQIILSLGYGHYFPWSVPILYSGAGGAAHTPAGTAGYLSVLLVALAGWLGTAVWWSRADQDR